MNPYFFTQNFHEILIFSILKNLGHFCKKWALSNFDNTFSQPTLHIVWNESQSGRMCSFISECPEKSKNLKIQVQLHIQNPIRREINFGDSDVSEVVMLVT